MLIWGSSLNRNNHRVGWVSSKLGVSTGVVEFVHSLEDFKGIHFISNSCMIFAPYRSTGIFLYQPFLFLVSELFSLRQPAPQVS